MTFLMLYLSFGAGMYTYAAVTNRKSYKEASKFSVFMGIIGALFWPVTLYVLLT